jgi:hypothetical protein
MIIDNVARNVAAQRNVRWCEGSPHIQHNRRVSLSQGERGGEGRALGNIRLSKGLCPTLLYGGKGYVLHHEADSFATAGEILARPVVQRQQAVTVGTRPCIIPRIGRLSKAYLEVHWG